MQDWEKQFTVQPNH